MTQPAIDPFDHPIFDEARFRLETPAMKQMHETVLRWLWTGATGGVLIGDARIGKTTAMLSLVDKLYMRNKVPIPTVFLSASERDQATIRGVYQRMCRAVDLPAGTATADTLCELFIHYILDRTTQAECRHCLLIVDEMQDLKILQFEPFSELYNALRLLNVHLRVVFIGNETESLTMLKELQKKSNEHLFGRFFRRQARIMGLTSHADVKACLKQYDRLRYPDDGPTYTGYFLQDAVRSGWTLASLSPQVWQVYSEYQRDYRLRSWGMQYFTATINVLLTDFLPQYGVDAVDDDMMRECIELSGLIPSLVVPEQ